MDYLMEEDVWMDDLMHIGIICRHGWLDMQMEEGRTQY